MDSVHEGPGIAARGEFENIHVPVELDLSSNSQ